jgi:Putative prokaryotic signal transducing protein
MMPSDRIPAPDELEEVFRSIDAIEVKMARDLLTGAGIDCFVFDADMARMLGSTGAVVARLMVFAEAADDARERLKELGFSK